MKILVCTDGSDYSQKALEKASKIADGCKNIEEISIIYVHDNRYENVFVFPDGIPPQQIENIEKMNQEYQIIRKKTVSQKILAKAAKIFKEKNINVRTLYKEGHPSRTIVQVAEDENFDIIVIGSEGISGIRKYLIGSVSNAVVQEAKCSVLIVK